MMLRTTISRIKKVCTVAFIPRLLRGDQRCAPCKFEILSYAPVKKLQKSTKSTDDDEFDHKKEKPKDVYEFYAPKKERQSQTDKYKNDGEPNLGDEIVKENVTQMVEPDEISRSEKCQRIIDKAFGKEEPEPNISQHYCSQSLVKIEETRREIDAELAKLKYGEQKLLDKANTELHHGSFEQTNVRKDEHLEPDNLNNPILNATTVEHNSLKKQTGPLDPFSDPYTDPYGNDNIVQQVKTSDLISEEKGPPDIKTMHKRHRYNLESEDKPAPTLMEKLTGSDTSPLKTLTSKDVSEDPVSKNPAELDDENEPLPESRIFSTSQAINPKPHHVQHKGIIESVDNNAFNPEKMENNLNSYLRELDDLKIVQATTRGEEEEEKLAQKIEKIEETPLVEAAKPTIEGFNVTPRVMGDSHIKITDNNDVPGTCLDEVAKRCMVSPTNQIDEILLKEMEKLGVTLNPSEKDNARSSITEDVAVKVDAELKKAERPVEKKDIESHEGEREAANLYSPDSLYSTGLLTKEKLLPDIAEESEAKTDNKSPKESDIHPHQVLIDPYDKKTLSYDTGEYDPKERYDPSKKFSYYYVPAETQGSEIECELPPGHTTIQDSNKIEKVEMASENISRLDKSEQQIKEPILDEAVTAGTMFMGTSEIERSLDHKYSENQAVDKSEEVQDVSSAIESAKHRSKILRANKIAEAYSIDSKLTKPKQSVADYLFNREQLDPNHVLTCNETCPIAPSGFRNPDDLFNSPIDTTAIYDSTLRNPFNSDHTDNSPNVVVASALEHEPKITSQKEDIEPDTCNKTNMCVSDDIWDEKIDYTSNELHNMYENLVDDPPQDTLRICDAKCALKDDKAQMKMEDAQTKMEDAQTKMEEAQTVTERNQIRPILATHENQTRAQPVAPRNHIRPIPPPPPHVSTANPYNMNSSDRPVGAKGNLECYFSKLDRQTPSPQTELDKLLNPVMTESGTIDDTVNTSITIQPLPKLNEDVSLSELLRRVRERSRIMECSTELKSLGVEAEPTEAKCPRKGPRCPPMAPRSPPNDPIPPPSFGLPKLKPRPPACKPKRGPKKNKCTSCDVNLSPTFQIGPILGTNPCGCHEVVCEINELGGPEITIATSKADLTDEVIDRLQYLGQVLGGVLQKTKADLLEAGVVRKHQRAPKVLLARDYKPWTPIPSWPEPIKRGRYPEPPGAPGCKRYPPTRSEYDPPCKQRPCQFPRKHFSVLDCFAVSLGDHKVYDLGEF